MPFIPVGFANYQLLFRAPNGRPAMCQMGFQPAAVSEGSIHDGIAEAVDGSWWANTDDSWTITGARVIIGTTDPTEPITLEVGENESGGNSGGAQTPNTSWLIHKRTNRGGRRGRGRQFFPGVPDDYCDDAGLLTVDLGVNLTSFETFWTSLLDDISAPGEETGKWLLHTTDEDGDPNEITSFAIDGMVATQRRRLRA